MDDLVTAADANRHFSSLLARVREGHSYTITSHGKPVARIIPAAQGEAERKRARAALLARLESQPVMDIGTWTRDELYEEGS
jgi:prevent-host-death family protein